MLPLRDVNPTRARPIITWTIILINVVVYFLVQPSDPDEAQRFAYERAAIACELTTGAPLDAAEIRSGRCSDEPIDRQVFPDKNVWLAGAVSMFLHGGLAHLLFNMWSLWIFGNNVEEAFGPVPYAIFYGAAGLAATAGFVVFNPDLTVPLVGASGAIAGVMGAYLVLFPRHQIMTLFFIYVTAIPAVVFLGIWFVSQFGFADPASGIAWEAHVVGFVVGALVAGVLRRRLLANVLHPEPPVRRPS